jgi:hypothetical protein
LPESSFGQSAWCFGDDRGDRHTATRHTPTSTPISRINCTATASISTGCSAPRNHVIDVCGTARTVVNPWFSVDAVTPAVPFNLTLGTEQTRVSDQPQPVLAHRLDSNLLGLLLTAWHRPPLARSHRCRVWRLAPRESCVRVLVASAEGSPRCLPIQTLSASSPVRGQVSNSPKREPGRCGHVVQGPERLHCVEVPRVLPRIILVK